MFILSGGFSLIPVSQGMGLGGALSAGSPILEAAPLSLCLSKASPAYSPLPNQSPVPQLHSAGGRQGTGIPQGTRWWPSREYFPAFPAAISSGEEELWLLL